ncbi:hypothetical protein OSB04_029734 [Centaurea solstitialis]|uniref:RING-type E3 ubiquitin transferase n=1 Tax=Centaurea solstitialis TaxID=347529 RepID=A0AA38SJ91_9ASTR|nr:hypothetical protein OSB04_029734 [Centaurea solstitialis]
MATTTTTATAAVPPNNHQWTEFQEEPNPNSYALSGKIMLASIIILFAVVIFLVLLHLYARWYLLRLHRRNHHNHHNRRRNRHNRSTRIVFYLDPTTSLSAATGGLDSSVLKTLPLFVYSPENEKNPPECAVCLSEFELGETGRVLPKCKHSFHTECIDMWFHSNSTCPLCRSPVEAVQSEMAVFDFLTQPPPEFTSEPGSSVVNGMPPVRTGNGETNETTSLGDRRKGIDVRIDVPTRTELDNEFRLASPSHGFRSPASRLLALKRILSMNRKSPAASPSAAGVGPSRLPAAAELDIESAAEESARLS